MIVLLLSSESQALTMQTGNWMARALADVANERRALILLNTPLDSALVSKAWGYAHLHICCDGAADRLRASNLPHLEPDLIVGDLDSVTPGALSHYRGLGCEVMDLCDDQESTDLDKALAAAAARGCDAAVVLGRYSGSCGRLDHTFGIVQSLFGAQTPRGPFADILVLSEDSAMQLLLPRPPPCLSASEPKKLTQAEEHVLETIVGSACGLIPIAGPCLDVSTQGLQWDVSHQRLAFGGLISTSNRAAKAQVRVATDGPLLWTMSFAESSNADSGVELSSSGRCESEERAAHPSLGS